MQRLIALAGLSLLVSSAQAQTYYHEPTQPEVLLGFGGAVAIGSNAIFVGEPLNGPTPGMVYVYRKGTAPRAGWTEAVRLSASNGRPSDRFGSALGVHGTLLAVGAPAADSGRGAVYLFEAGRGGGWTERNRLTVSSLAVTDNLGGSLALSEDLLLVSAVGHDSSMGMVHAWRRNGSEWVSAGTLTGSDSKRGDRFGSSIAIHGRVALIGAPRHNDQAGAAYVFRFDPATSAWKEESKLTGRNTQRNNWFGASVAIQGSELMVGSPRFSNFSGGVFLFTRDTISSSWRPGPMMAPFDGGNVQFGSSIAWDGNELWIGAPSAGTFSGRVYQFSRDTAGEWLGASKLGLGDAERGDFYAGAISLRGPLGVVGLTGDDFGAGTAIVYERTAATPWRNRARLLSEESSFAAVTGAEQQCQEGNSKGFGCSDVDLLSFIPVKGMGGKRGVQLSGMWGWTDPESSREFALIGRVDGTSFVEVTDPSRPRYLGDLPLTAGARPSNWREIKTYRHYAYIVSDGAGEHGMQIFDLNQLKTVRGAPVTFKETAHYDRIHSAHNVLINQESGFLYLVGGSEGGETCGGAYHIASLQDPLNPSFAGCFGDTQTGRASTGYSHDALCVMYRGPDQQYQGREICLGSNETALSITDLSDKRAPKVVSRASYPNVAYAHQGWLSEDQRYFFMNDELDELGGSVKSTRTLVWDLNDLDDPVLAKEFLGTTGATDHNLYIRGNRMYQSNYVAGLRVIDISDPTNPKEVGYFDTVPYGENVAGFGGTWSNYPYFKNGVVAVSSRREGLFLVRPRQAPVP
jgi:choice-of-anchor B domain-containing protein